ncbi:hypothetical protein Rhopal_001299-T1 [Rhodotorula paludigena]|uniref:Proteophosphoglycan ppg4 n=1 Tax=Rhodotorula paludigena TaxID=86838 RepID=A0AAV5GEL9_9BASI|nr:hypothetical protein Rhopal_001299-T1 [Rhodotorula paludigena]
MAARPEPQSTEIGSLWPSWCSGEFLEIKATRLAQKGPFYRIVLDDTKRNKSIITYECDLPSQTGGYCGQLWRIQLEPSTGQFMTTAFVGEHTHELPRPASKEGLAIRQANDEIFRDAVRELLVEGEKRFAHLSRRADFRVGYEEEDPCAFTPTDLQISCVWDIKHALGGKVAKKFENDMRLKKLTAPDYPRLSALKGPNPLASPPYIDRMRKSRAPSLEEAPTPSKPLHGLPKSFTSSSLIGPVPEPFQHSPGTSLPPAEVPPFMSIKGQWENVEQAVRDYAASHSFRVAEIEDVVGERGIGMRCTSEGCAWVAWTEPTFDGWWQFVEKRSCFEHTLGGASAGVSATGGRIDDNEPMCSNPFGTEHTASGNEAAALDWSSYFPRKPKRPLDDVPSEYSVDSDDETLIVITPTPEDSASPNKRRVYQSKAKRLQQDNLHLTNKTANSREASDAGAASATAVGTPSQSASHFRSSVPGDDQHQPASSTEGTSAPSQGGLRAAEEDDSKPVLPPSSSSAHRTPKCARSSPSAAAPPPSSEVPTPELLHYLDALSPSGTFRYAATVAPILASAGVTRPAQLEVLARHSFEQTMDVLRCACGERSRLLLVQFEADLRDRLGM